MTEIEGILLFFLIELVFLYNSIIFRMETKKKHNEEVAELNQQIDFIFGTVPTLLQVRLFNAI